jgi:peptidyl-prolyl cis-trans isomerase B (cyclophilin B)
MSTDADADDETLASATLRGSGTAKAPPKFRLPVVLIETSLGNIKVRLRDDKASQTVENFLDNYVDRGFYEQTIFHHVEKGVMIVAGGYTEDLQPKSTRAWIRNQSNNGLSNRRGTIAMAHHPDYPHSATSQFFINVADNSSYDFRAPQEGELSEEAYGYCVFGEVIEGLDVADRIARVAVHSTESFPAVPVEPVLINSIRYDE